METKTTLPTATTLASVQEVLVAKTQIETFEKLVADQKQLISDQQKVIDELRVEAQKGGSQLLAYEKRLSELTSRNSILEAKETRELVAASSLGMPEIGAKVFFINHALGRESGEVTGHGLNTLHLRVTGRHPNDVTNYNDVPFGGPGKRLTWYPQV